MSMKQNGLAKLVEECGEVLQVAGKMIQYPELQFSSYETHPDGTILREKLEEEIADALAALDFVSEKLKLDIKRIDLRAIHKAKLFKQWDNEE